MGEGEEPNSFATVSKSMNILNESVDLMQHELDILNRIFVLIKNNMLVMNQYLNQTISVREVNLTMVDRRSPIVKRKEGRF